ncbi:MAG: D-2-hydroxyacid dehydrogenase [Hyphomicrobiaceae bacterium]
MQKKPLMLLLYGNTKPYVESLAAAGLGERYDIVALPPDKTPDANHLQNAEVLMAINAAPGMIGEMPKLKWVQSVTVGVDHWLDRKDLTPRHLLTAARGTHRVQMPENILGAIFHITKNYMAAALQQRESKWVRRVSEPIAGKTLGILGLGAIGQELARKAAALELKVIGTKRTVEPVPHVDKVYAPEQIDEVLAQSDYVVLLLPVTEATNKLMNKERLSHMKPNAWLLNFGRGHLIVDEDLIAAAKAKTIAGAILDVFRTEPLPPEHPFWKAEGILVLPHIGGGHPTRDRMVAELFTENAKRFLAGEPLKELVDRERGY